MKRNLILSSLLVIIVSLVFTGVVMAQDDPESGYPIEYPDYPVATCEESCWWCSPADCDAYYDAHPDEYCEAYPDKCEVEAPSPTKQPQHKSEPAPIKRSKWVEPPVIVQVKQVVQKSIMELIEGLRMMLRMR